MGAILARCRPVGPGVENPVEFMLGGLPPEGIDIHQSTPAAPCRLMRINAVPGRAGLWLANSPSHQPLRGAGEDMHDWNVVVSVHSDCYPWVRQRLREYGRVNRTDYYNVLALQVADPPVFVAELHAATESDPRLRDCLSRVMPAQHTFMFQNPEEFEQRAREAVAGYLSVLAGKTFYVRLHRRGFRGTLASQKMEQMLDHVLLEGLAAAGTPGQVHFANADAVVVIETVGQWAGVTLVTRELHERCPFVDPE
jgi:tRNA(Ser,Leu) C12 N-acetylase TAN1